MSNDLQAQVFLLKTEVVSLKAKDLEIEAKIAILETNKANPSIVPNLDFDISQVTFQKLYSVVKLVVNDFSINTVALIDSGTDQNCIKGGIILTKYCERTKEHLASANDEPLSIQYKLNKGYIQNDGYGFKNVFFIVDNITNDIIVGTPFLTQIYPFYVNETGVHTKIMGKPISFNFLSEARLN